MLIADCRCPTCGGDLPDTDLVVDIDDTNTAVRNGLVVSLSPQNAVLLWLLAKSAPRVVSRDMIISSLWSVNEPEAASRAIDVRVSRLRRDIEPLGLTIVTARGTGYSLRKLELWDERPRIYEDAAFTPARGNSRERLLRRDAFVTELSQYDTEEGLAHGAT